MSNDAAIIRQSMVELDRLRCRSMTTDRLRANVATYPPGGANGAWRDACVCELAFRGVS